MYELIFHKRVEKQEDELRSEKSAYAKLKLLYEILEIDPFQPPYEKLVGNLLGFCSRRINIKHRLVYKVDEENKVVYVASVRKHYEF